MRKIHQTTISGHSLIELDPLPKDFYIRCLGIFGTSQIISGQNFWEGKEASFNIFKQNSGEFPPSCWIHPLRHRSLSPRPQRPTSQRGVGLKAVFNCQLFRYVQINMVFYGFYDVLMMLNLNQFELTDALRSPAVPHVPPPKTCSLDGGGDSILQSCPILLVCFVHCLS